MIAIDSEFGLGSAKYKSEKSGEISKPHVPRAGTTKAITDPARPGEGNQPHPTATMSQPVVEFYYDVGGSCSMVLDYADILCRSHVPLHISLQHGTSHQTR